MHLIFRILIVAIFIINLLGINQSYGYTKAIESCGGYPVQNVSDLGPEPKDVPVEKIDINSDGLIDLIAIYPWGGSSLFINGGGGKYYCSIKSNTRIKVKSLKKGGWAIFSLNPSYSNDKVNDLSTLIDGKLYGFSFLPFDSEDESKIDSDIKYNGINYSLPFKECKTLGIHAPRYRFEKNVVINEKRAWQNIKLIVLELGNTSIQIKSESQEIYGMGSVYFTDLNLDGQLDAVYQYQDKYGSDPLTYIELLLNCGDDSFVISGNIGFGRTSVNHPLKSRKITIGGKRFIGLAYQPQELKKKSQYELQLYQPELKEFIPIKAKLGQDKSTFIPLDKKELENIVNPPLFRNAPASSSNSTKAEKVDKSAISKLIDNYEKSIIKAINTNNFPLVAKYLTPGSNLYKSQKDLVAKLYQKKTREKLVGYKVEAIKATGQANVYQVYVTEKIGIKRADKADFTVLEFRWVYTVVADGTKYSLSEIAK